jgi:LysM repeat protein
MTLKSRSGILLTAFILLVFNCTLYSQVTVERSKEKVTIAGAPYYIHQVKPGETPFSISRAYSITVDELTKENPQALTGVKIGQSLRIPVKPLEEVKPFQQARPPRDDSRYVYHKLKPGETVYFLSKAYGVSENDVTSSNPGIEINKMPIGAEIAIPRRDFMIEKQKFSQQNSKYIYHQVIRGESLSSIAGIYGLSVRELRRENRDLRFPQVGDYVKVPNQSFVESSEPVGIDSVYVAIEEPVIVERPAGFTPVTELNGALDVAVLLPFYLQENSQRSYIDSSKQKQIRRVKRPDDWIYDWSLDFVEMYQGILLAADTLRSMGLNVNISVFDIKSDSIEVKNLINRGRLDNMDLIIGPVWSHNLSIVASWASPRGIPVVSPVPLYNNQVLLNKPDLFLPNSTLEVAQKTLARKVSEFPDHNLIFVHADTSGTDMDVKNFKSMILSELSNRMPFEEIRFREFLFYSRSAFGNDSINRLGHALSDKSKNLIIIASEDSPVISETIQNIHAFKNRYDIKVIGYPALRDQRNINPEYYFDLGLMLYSPYWIDFKADDIKAFNNDYRKKYFTQPSEGSYAWQGYDIAYYFLSGLAIHGKDFVLHPEVHNPDLLQTQFDFRRRQSSDGFENQTLYLIKYNQNYEIELVNDNEILPSN